MSTIYTKYLNQTNKVVTKRDKIHICALELEQELRISNKEKKQAFPLF